MGTQRRIEPGTENKIVLGIPGPTAYNLPSKVISPFFKVFRFKKALKSL